VERGLIACEGTGRKKDPFQYWLPEMEARWRENPWYEVLEAQKREMREESRRTSVE
jgi:hypothetical protein